MKELKVEAFEEFGVKMKVAITVLTKGICDTYSFRKRLEFIVTLRNSAGYM